MKQSSGALVARFDFAATAIADSLFFTKTAPLLFPDTGPFSMSVLMTYTLRVGGVFLSRGIAAEVGVAPQPFNLGDDAARFCRLRGDPRRGNGRSAAMAI